jgi:hypothetical protein
VLLNGFGRMRGDSPRVLGGGAAALLLSDIDVDVESGRVCAAGLHDGEPSRYQRGPRVLLHWVEEKTYSGAGYQDITATRG